MNTYIQADPAQTLGALSNVSLTQAIIETGIHDAIAKQLNEKGKLSKKSFWSRIFKSNPDRPSTQQRRVLC